MVAESVRLKPGREAATRRRHPWVFSGSLARPDDVPEGPVAIADPAGRVLGRGFGSPRSPIRARIWSFGEASLGPEEVAARVEDAARLRALVLPPETDGYRLVNAEGDFLPGLVVDRYGEVLVVQATTRGTELAREWWLPPLLRLHPAATIVQRNDLSSREGEGLRLEDELLAGTALPKEALFRERGLLFAAEVATGQKTGFFLDQRENRALVRELAAGRSVLNVFSYSGAFGVSALAGGAARVTHVDTSADALASARAHHARNGHDAARVETVAADAFDDLRARVARGEAWDLIVTDPPAFAKRRGDVDAACRGYKDVNRLAFKLLAPGGLLLACSCSGPVDPDLFQKVLFAAALDAGVPARLLGKRGAGPDHPVSIDCPEGAYLKAFLLSR